MGLQKVMGIFVLSVGIFLGVILHIGWQWYGSLRAAWKPQATAAAATTRPPATKIGNSYVIQQP